jgi:uracil-DNA glycosylase family 4
MEQSRRVLSRSNGPSDASILFVGEAPGRLGAQRTGIPFYGDRTGERFEQLLAAMEWTRDDVFITNAVLCNPRDDTGNNDVPNRVEIANCQSLLVATIDALNPNLVISLGNVALRALNTIREHGLLLRDSVGKIFPWHGRHLGVLYHPGPRTQVHRSWDLQVSDAVAIAKRARERQWT